MSAIYFLIPITLIILALAIGLFFWAINSDQYSDLDKESSQILFDQDSVIDSAKSSSTSSQSKAKQPPSQSTKDEQ